LCGLRVFDPCTNFVVLGRPKQAPEPPWPRYAPIDLPPDCFADNVEEKPAPGRLPLRPATAVLRSNMTWIKD